MMLAESTRNAISANRSLNNPPHAEAIFYSHSLLAGDEETPLFPFEAALYGTIEDEAMWPALVDRYDRPRNFNRLYGGSPNQMQSAWADLFDTCNGTWVIGTGSLEPPRYESVLALLCSPVTSDEAKFAPGQWAKGLGFGLWRAEFHPVLADSLPSAPAQRSLDSVPTWLADCAKRFNAGERRAAYRDAFSQLDRLFLDARWEEANTALAATSSPTIPTDLAIGMLRVASGAVQHIPAWRGIVSAIAARMEADGKSPLDEMEGLLS